MKRILFLLIFVSFLAQTASADFIESIPVGPGIVHHHEFREGQAAGHGCDSGRVRQAERCAGVWSRDRRGVVGERDGVGEQPFTPRFRPFAGKLLIYASSLCYHRTRD